VWLVMIGAACAAPRLDRFDQVEVPGSYTIDMVRRHGRWLLADPAPTKHHTEGTVLFDNLAEFPTLADRSEAVRFTADIVRESAVFAPAREGRDVTFHAHIVAVCLP
jgi:hypothetical protein